VDDSAARALARRAAEGDLRPVRAFDWHGLWAPRWPPQETALRAALVYLGVQVLLRVVGRKELGRYATFNVAILVLVTTAMRQTLVGDDTSLTTAFVALTTMVVLDAIISRLVARHRAVARVVEGDPVQLVRGGVVMEENLRRVHMSVAELMTWARLRGVGSLGDVQDAFLEPSGRVSVLARERRHSSSEP
jgi:uncharacterized membrane protein YcaP (DUF421 family)